ncbi:15-hydroxyprostaglandin dehydrogenase [NAD(+)]-like isoform X2 [Watersipora subatra]|uniref:15-hydroxyprostaglandin dehydrogenase [NAD(+)]-like isoform X2 n=1 Tax=Watersipora subatra TaxID=2589382 RepID=UPI00355C6C4D
MPVAGKVALITGGVGGLGKAFATALLQARAAAVCLVDINKRGEETAEELRKKFPTNQTVEFYECDVTDYNLFKGAFDFTEKKFGGIDIVCNNAGINALDHEIDKSIKAFRLNLEAVFLGTRLGQMYMDKSKGRGGGVIVNVASMAAFMPIENCMAYTGSKAGVVALTKSEASLEEYGVRVNCLCPSFTDTPILDYVEGTREAINMIPGHHILKPEFVAEGFMQLVEKEDLNGAIMRVTPQKGIDFYKDHKRVPSFSVAPSKL